MANAKAPNPKGTTRTASEARFVAEQAFTVYYALGPQRSIEKLREVQPTMGFKRIPRTTLLHYSTRYDWQRRVRELDNETARANNSASLQRVQEMNEQQAVIGQMGVQIAAMNLDRMRRQLSLAEPCDKCGIAPLEFDASETSTLMNTFAKWQRMGLGEVTDRTEIATTIWNVLIQEIVGLFVSVNVHEDPDARKRDFMLSFDDIIGRHLAAVKDGA